MGLQIVAVLSFGFGLILALVARFQLLILPSFWAVLGALSKAFSTSKKAAITPSPQLKLSIMV